MSSNNNSRLFGLVGESQLSSVLEMFGWGPVPNEKHDSGTDFFVQVREPDLVDGHAVERRRAGAPRSATRHSMALIWCHRCQVGSVVSRRQRTSASSLPEPSIRSPSRTWRTSCSGSCRPTTNRPRLHQPHQLPSPRTPDNMTRQPVPATTHPTFTRRANDLAVDLGSMTPAARLAHLAAQPTTNR